MGLIIFLPYSIQSDEQNWNSLGKHGKEIMKIEINTLISNPAVRPDMNAYNSWGFKTLRWDEDCVVSVLH